MNEQLKHKNRSKLRLFLGKNYYTYKKHLVWWFYRNRYTCELCKTPYNFCVFKHKTPLYRNLKDVPLAIQKNKIVNLKIAIQTINGLVIKPHQVFSYWHCIGNPTYKKGYKDGMILTHGKYTTGPGGGLCQLSNMLFWLFLHSRLTITERHRHSFDVFPDSNRTQPFGSGATCSYNYLDLQVLNETECAYQLYLWLDDSYLHGALLSSEKDPFSYQIHETDHVINHEYWGAYTRHNKINRCTIDQTGQTIFDEVICENHALMMYEPLIPRPFRDRNILKK